jgi:hypothetical protein
MNDLKNNLVVQTLHKDCSSGKICLYIFFIFVLNNLAFVSFYLS